LSATRRLDDFLFEGNRLHANGAPVSRADTRLIKSKSSMA
jgi:hypothetical protein